MSPKLTRKEMKLIQCNDEIRRYRNEVCYTQEYMATRLGITQSTYQRIEAGEIKISMDRLIEISRILDKPVELFLRNKDRLIPSIELINVNKREWQLMLNALTQQENRIKELEAKVLRKDKKIEELKYQLGLSQVSTQQKRQD
ncbi:helix-turn-helix domain-containing protein [Pedobacter sp. Hv1]|uniref:helix-turn-helix domain-containing protein n=1 Tax=Pedobacter sp. Hv1 TaxID=1740090 RepID=UPI0006D8D6F7|nr:helix-turn-helix transcriptional regulator [Pedobacter sp. Hv1]KQC01431.1 hypothetical protein AQF98_06910 [Pedobacter sp. Hv1]